MTSENLRTTILKEYELGLMTDNELSSLLMDFAMKYHAEQCNITDVSQAFCKCDKIQPNYPEMVWCDNCGLEIKQNANVTNKPIKTLNHKEDCTCGDCTLLAKVFGNGG